MHGQVKVKINTSLNTDISNRQMSPVYQISQMFQPKLGHLQAHTIKNIEKDTT
jgi:hypothetical protein